MRLIDADSLFQKLGDIKPKNKTHYESIGEFMNMITNSPTIESDWIPTSSKRKLPEYRETVLISSFWGVRIAWRDAIKEDGTDDFWRCPLEDSDVYPQYVYAWMLLPQPYKEGKQE